MAFLLHTVGHLATVHDLVYPALTKWYNIGLQLKLPAYALDAIERSRGDDGDHLRDTLKKWLERDAPTPTIKALVDALKSSPVGESRLACDVEDKLHSLPNSPSFDKSTHTPLVLSRQCSLPLWIKVVIIFGLIFPVAVFLNIHSDYIHTLFRRVMYRMNLLDSRSLPFLDHKVFVGRKQSEIQIIQEIYKTHPPIISIVGPPGFGKSTLAIHVGHAMVANGFLVNYVDMSVVSGKQAFVAKILAGDTGTVAIKSVTVERLYKWARELNHRTFLILDNCDVILHNTTDLQTVVEKLLDNSPRLKILITSRKTVWQLNQFTYRLENLSSEASCTLLQKVTYYEGLNSTTCKLIASLTGNVPLALQVVGAILNDVNSPDIVTIMHSLEQDLIPTLSPEDLPVEQRVNASITLSYQYLTPQMQKIGRYLANFQGSFDKEASCDILISVAKNSITCSELAKFLEDLVKRSLLECDRRRNRYQFHTLIREFFLAVSNEATGENETNQFMIHFQSFYISVLQTLTKQFTDNHNIQAFTKLDVERHNILHLLEYLGDPGTMIDDTSDLLSAVRTVRFSFDVRFLRCRFTSSELLRPVSRIVERLSQQVNLLLKQPVSVTSYFRNYVHMIIYLAQLEEELNGASKAVQIFTAAEYNVVNMEKKQSAEDTDMIVLFYRKLSHYYWLLEEHARFKECHEKILKLTSDLLAACESGKCYYDDIGRAYYDIEDYANSAHFFQLALDLESKKLTMHRMLRINLMALLHLSYYKIHDTVKAENVLQKLTVLLPEIKRKPATEVYQFIYVLKSLINIYQLNNKRTEAGQLKDVLIKAVRQVGAKPTVSFVKTARELAEYFIETGCYQQADDLAEFALQSFSQLSKKEELKTEKAEIQGTLSLAKFVNWKLAEGLDYFQPALDYIICEYLRPWTTSNLTDWQIFFISAYCGDLCSSQLMLHCLVNILSYGFRIAGTLIFHTLLEMTTVEENLAQKSRAENQVLSLSTEVVIASEDVADSLLISVPHSVTLWSLAHVTSLSIYAFLSSCIWLSVVIINVSYVMEKLYLVLCLAYFLWWCITSIIDSCRVFIEFVLYIVILYTVRISPLFIIYVLSRASHSRTFTSWFLLTMFACLSFMFMKWFEVNAFEFVMAVIILTSFKPVWHCTTKIIHYCKRFVDMYDLILSSVNHFVQFMYIRIYFIHVAVWSILFSIVIVPYFLLLGGVTYSIFEVNEVLTDLVTLLVLLSLCYSVIRMYLPKLYSARN